MFPQRFEIRKQFVSLDAEAVERLPKTCDEHVYVSTRGKLEIDRGRRVASRHHVW